MDVQVTQSAVGAFVPQFLVNFKGDYSLERYFWGVLKTNYNKAIVNLDIGNCQSCYVQLTFNDRPRIKSSQSMTKKVQKLLARSSLRPLGKYHACLVQRFLRSSTQLTVKCRSCGHVNRRQIISNEVKVALKDRLLKSSEMIPEPVQSVSKKKKKKKKRKEKDDNSGLIIPGSHHGQNKPTEDVSSHMENSQFSPLPDRFFTPLCAKREVSSNTWDSVSAKIPNKLTPAQAYSSKGVVTTPATGKLPGSLSNFGQMTPQQKRERAGHVSAAVNRKMKHKQLQEFLSQESVSAKKPASLADFLSSL